MNILFGLALSGQVYCFYCSRATLVSMEEGTLPRHFISMEEGTSLV